MGDWHNSDVSRRGKAGGVPFARSRSFVRGTSPTYPYNFALDNYFKM